MVKNPAKALSDLADESPGKAILVSIVASAGVGLGVGGLLWLWNKMKKKDEDTDDDGDNGTTTPPPTFDTSQLIFQDGADKGQKKVVNVYIPTTFQSPSGGVPTDQEVIQLATQQAEPYAKQTHPSAFDFRGTTQVSDKKGFYKVEVTYELFAGDPTL